LGEGLATANKMNGGKTSTTNLEKVAEPPPEIVAQRLLSIIMSSTEDITSVAASISPSCLPHVQMRSMSQYDSVESMKKNTNDALATYPRDSPEEEI